MSETNRPWYQTVRQRQYTKVYPSTQALFIELREARSYGWQLASLVQQQAMLVTTFTRHHRNDETGQRLSSDRTW